MCGSKAKEQIVLEVYHGCHTLIISTQLGWAEGFATFLAEAPFLVDDVVLDILKRVVTVSSEKGWMGDREEL